MDTGFVGFKICGIWGFGVFAGLGCVDWDCGFAMAG